MPASFKVRAVPLDGSNEAFEEVLDPDFGESAIGRVAPIDSGKLFFIWKLRHGSIACNVDALSLIFFLFPVSPVVLVSYYFLLFIILLHTNS